MPKHWTLKEYADHCKVSEQRARVYCRKGRVPGARQKIIDGHAVWLIPMGSEKPPALPPGLEAGQPRRIRDRNK